MKNLFNPPMVILAYRVVRNYICAERALALTSDDLTKVEQQDMVLAFTKMLDILSDHKDDIVGGGAPC